MMTRATAAFARPIRIGRWALRTCLLASPLALALILLDGCQCPEPHHPQRVRDDVEHVRAVETTIVNAQARHLWTSADEREFRNHMGNMSLETRFELAKRIATLINTKAIRIDNPKSRTPPPRICPCTPGFCDADPVPAAPAPTTSSMSTSAHPPATAAVPGDAPAPATGPAPVKVQPGPKVRARPLESN